MLSHDSELEKDIENTLLEFESEIDSLKAEKQKIIKDAAERVDKNKILKLKSQIENHGTEG